MELKDLLKLDIQDIIKSPEYSMFLIKTYSDLYMNGAQARICAKSQEKYLKQLKIDGMEKLNRINIPSFTGKKYISSIVKDGKTIIMHQHVHSDNLSDELATKLLKSGALMESDFKVLPYKKVEPIIEKINVKDTYTIDEIKAVMVGNDYKQKIKVGKTLGLVKGNIKEAKLDEKLNNYIENNS